MTGLIWLAVGILALVIIVRSTTSLLQRRLFTPQSLHRTSVRVRRRKWVAPSGQSRPLLRRRINATAKDLLLSKGENAFYLVLRDVVPASHRVMCKVRVADVIDINGRREFEQLAKMHFDFVLVDDNSAEIAVAIELDDKSHRRLDRRQRDRLLNATVRAAGRKLIRIRNQEAYDVQHLRELIRKAINVC
jgi:hypothetical protein